TPDDTWSNWSPAYTNADGSPITSPKARYLQWRAVLTGKGDGPVLTSVTAAYLQRNLRPVVRSITVQPAGIVFQKPFSTGDPERDVLREGRCVRRALQSARDGAQRRARQRRVRGGQHAAVDQCDERARRRWANGDLIRREGRSLADSRRRVLARRPAVARRL